MNRPDRLRATHCSELRMLADARETGEPALRPIPPDHRHARPSAAVARQRTQHAADLLAEGRPPASPLMAQAGIPVQAGKPKLRFRSIDADIGVRI